MIALYNEFNKKYPKDMTFRQQLADHFWYTTERYEWAAKLYEEILKNEPECKNVEIYERLGTAYKLMGNKKKALTAFKTGIEWISNQSDIKKDSKNEKLLKILKDEIDLINKK
jgi:tetratricopeptide (TPR) repeat protein